MSLLPKIRTGKDDNKVVNLIHLFCVHCANSVSQEQCAVQALCCSVSRRLTQTNSWQRPSKPTLLVLSPR